MDIRTLGLVGCSAPWAPPGNSSHAFGRLAQNGPAKLFNGEHLHFSADDPTLEPLHRRLKVGEKVSSAALAEMRDWEMISRSLDPGEVRWARIAARGYLPPAARGDGFLFLTNKHLFFA